MSGNMSADSADISVHSISCCTIYVLIETRLPAV